MKKLLLLIILIFLIGCSYEDGILSIDFNKIKNNTEKEDDKILTDFKDFNLNPEKYLNQTITIKGNLFRKESPYEMVVLGRSEKHTFYQALTDKEDFTFMFYPKYNRAFEIGKKYILKGIVKKEKERYCFKDCDYIYFLLEK